MFFAKGKDYPRWGCYRKKEDGHKKHSCEYCIHSSGDTLADDEDCEDCLYAYVYDKKGECHFKEKLL